MSNAYFSEDYSCRARASGHDFQVISTNSSAGTIMYCHACGTTYALARDNRWYQLRFSELHFEEAQVKEKRLEKLRETLKTKKANVASWQPVDKSS